MGPWIALISIFLAEAVHAHTFHLITGIPSQKIILASPLNEWGSRVPASDPEFSMAFQETSPGHYSLSLPQPWLQLLEYKLIVDGRWQLDPNNPKTATDSSGNINSVWDTGFQDDPLLKLQPGVPSPTVKKLLIPASGDQQAREILLIIPRDQLNDAGKRKVIAYFQDGVDYLQQAQAEALLANLSAQDQSPTILGAMIPPVDRNQEYWFSDKYADFFMNAVVPQVESQLNQKFEPQDRALIGASLGGLASLYLLLQSKGFFGALGSQSGSFWAEKFRAIEFIRQMPDDHFSHTNFCLSDGIFESEDIIDSNRRMARLLQEKSAHIEFLEVPGQHRWSTWKNNLPWLLRCTFKER